MEPGFVVEFIDSQKIYCAVVLESKSLRLRLLTENNREIKLSTNRLAHRCHVRLDVSSTRDKLVAELKTIAARRRALSGEVDIQGLWDVVHTEQEWIDLQTMTGLCFSDEVDGDHESAVLRAFFNDRLYFKFSVDGFFPHTPQKVDQILGQREAQESQERLIDQGAVWLQRVSKGQRVDPPSEAEAIIPVLVSYYLFENDSPERVLARAILKKAGINTPAHLFSFFVKQGIWSPHENIDLLRFGVRGKHSEAVETLAREQCRRPIPSEPQRRDLTHLPTITIDGPSTLDFDDALSLTMEGEYYQLGIHIADVAAYIAKDDRIDRDAMERVSSIYMPDQKIAMLPPVISEGLCSLKVDQVRPAISTLITLSPQFQIVDYEVTASLIKVARQLTYGDIEDLLNDDLQIRAMHKLSEGYRQRRLDSGALPIELPEVTVSLSPSNEPTVTKIERETTSRFLVAELMIMANELAARSLKDAGLPAIFRSQAEPRERLFERDQGTLFKNWMQRKHISRFMLGSAPEPHAGLGVTAYATCTSPIRKYSDLVNQRQIRAVLGLEDPYTKEQIDYIIATLMEPLAQIGRIQFRRHRYWVLKYLEGCIGQKEEAVVLSRRREGYAVLLVNYMIETTLAGGGSLTLKPEDLIQVTLQHANARNDLLTVFFG